MMNLLRASRVSTYTALLLTAFALAVFATPPAEAQGPPCLPCAGIEVDDVETAVTALETGLRIEHPARLYVSWPAELDGSAETGAAEATFEQVREAGGTPWLRTVFRTPAPVLEHQASLEAELRELATLTRGSGELAHLQFRWQPETGDVTAAELAYVIKRATVAITGGNAEARVLVGPIDPDPDLLRALYDDDLAAYADGLVFRADAGELDPALAVVRDLDPGKPVVLAGLPWPEAPSRTLVAAAEASERGFGVALFDFPRPTELAGDMAESESTEAEVLASALAPLKILAREFQGDMSADPDTVPRGAERAYTYVRGEDLSLRVIVEAPATAGETTDEMVLEFDDPFLRSPRVIGLDDGFASTVFGQRRTETGLVLPVEEPRPVTLLSLERMTAAEMEGFEEKTEVESERRVPVEEILRRLQASEDHQARRLDHYEASNILHLRFKLTGAGGVEVSFEGPFFFEQDVGFDWVWETVYFNGVKWKGKKLPEIPIVQPEKAAVFPLEISFTREYAYTLRGTETVGGRDAWVIDFEPVETPPEGETLYRGTVWVDREHYVRIKTRSLQVGLDGQVLSNDETVFFTPVDADGAPTAWTRDAFYLPTRVKGQQVWSVLNAVTQVEREAVLSDIRINGPGYEERLAEVHASEKTIVRDTDDGLRYLAKTETGERVVKERFDTGKLFVLGGVFYDEGQDFPIPLAGVNYLDLDFLGRGGQVNVFFAGAFLQANVAQPRLFDSKWDVGAALNGFFVDLGDELYRDGEEVPQEEVESRNLGVAVFLGRQLGEYGKLDLTLGADRVQYSTADDTAEAFVLPEDGLETRAQIELSYARSGWRFRARGSVHEREDWSFWGLPGNTDFVQEQEEYLRWDLSLSKVFWLSGFKKLGFEIEHLDGEDLDRFSRWDFGIFGGANVAGYQNGLVRASEADGLHVDYGIDVGEVFQVELALDAVWASDEATGLDEELLSGIGVEGTTMGPWDTILNFELGYALTGPGEDGVAVRFVFLRLFD